MDKLEKIVNHIKTRNKDEMEDLLKNILTLYNEKTPILKFLKIFILGSDKKLYSLRTEIDALKKIQMINDQEIVQNLGILIVFYMSYLKGGFDGLKSKLEKKIPRSVIDKPIFINFYKSFIINYELFKKSIDDNTSLISSQNITSVKKKLKYLKDLSDKEIKRELDQKILDITSKYEPTLVHSNLIDELLYLVTYGNKVDGKDKSNYYNLIVYNLDSNQKSTIKYYISIDDKLTKMNIKMYQNKVLISLLNFIQFIPKLNYILEICYQNISKDVKLFDGENICYDYSFKSKYGLFKKKIERIRDHNIFIITLQQRRIDSVVPTEKQEKAKSDSFYIEEINNHLFIILFCHDPQNYRGSRLSSEMDDYSLLYLADKLRIGFKIVSEPYCVEGRLNLDLIEDIVKRYSIITCDKYGWLYPPLRWQNELFSKCFVGGGYTKKKIGKYAKRSKLPKNRHLKKISY